MALVRVYCGLASAEQARPTELAVALVDDSGRLLDVCDISDDPAGYSVLGTLLAERSTGPTGVAIAADSDDHLVTMLLTAAGRPLAFADDDSVDDYAERFADDESVEEMESPEAERRAIGLARALQAGALSAVALPAPREMAALKPVLAAHAAVVVGRQAAAVALREVLRELYPAALRAYPDPAEAVPLAILDALPEPGLVTSSPASRGRDAAGRGREAAATADAVVNHLVASGVADPAALSEAITALRVAIAETPRKGSLGRSLTTAVAATIREAVAAVRAFDAASAALIGALADRANPRATTPRPRVLRQRSAPTPSSVPPAATLRSVREPTSEHAAVRVPLPRRNRASVSPISPAAAGSAPAAARAGSGRAAPTGPTFIVSAPPAAQSSGVPAGAPRPASAPPAAMVSAPPADHSRAGATVPPPPPGITPISPSPVLPAKPASPAYPASPAASYGPPAGSGRGEPAPYAAPPSTYVTPSAYPPPASYAPPSTYPPPPAYPPPSAYPPPAPYVVPAPAPYAVPAPSRTPRAAEAFRTSVSGTTGDGRAPGVADYGMLRSPLEPPMPPPPAAPPGSRANWPLAGSDEPEPVMTGLAPDPILGDPYADLGLPPRPSAEGRVTPPWQADDLPPEPSPMLRLVEPPPLADPVLRRGDDLGDGVRFDPPALRLVDTDDSTRGGRGLGAPRGRRPGAAPVSVPPVAEDNDADLLIFAAARSAWFTGQAQDGDTSDWTSLADDGWRAAEQAARPSVGAATTAGLPKRVPQANLVPGSALPPDDRPLRIVRDPASIAAHTSGYFRGWRRGQEINGYAVGGRPGRESAQGWDFSRDIGAAQEYDEDYDYRAAAYPSR